MTQDVGERVYLYIYDLSQGLARSMSLAWTGRQIDGIWHTSVVCYGYEFYYGHGIFVTDRVGRTQYGTPVEVKDMGITELPQEIFIEYVDSLRKVYTPEKYHLLDNNCNTFTNDLCQFLVGKPIPGHISSLPQDVLNTPLGQAIRPMIDATFAPPPQAEVQPIPSRTQVQTSPLATSQIQQDVYFPSTPADFNATVNSSKMAIAFFTSETCGPCKMIEPHFRSLSKTHTNIKFIQVDTHFAFAVAQHHQITATPTFKTFFNGKLHSEWKGADISALDSNLSRLVEAARPPLPPSLRGNYSQSPILFARPPPMEKVIPELPSGVFSKPLLDSISAFLSSKGDTEVPVPPLLTWTQCLRNLDYGMENAWMAVDLLRAAVADRRVSGWFAIDGLDTFSDIVRKVSSRGEEEWQLRVVTVQLIANMFSTPLLTVISLKPFLPEMVELLTSSILSCSTAPRLNLVKAAASALFNLSRISLDQSVAPGEDEILSIVVALVECLKTLLDKKTQERKDLERLLVVCLGGYLVLGGESTTINEVLEGVEAIDIINRMEGSVPKEVVNLIQKSEA